MTKSWTVVLLFVGFLAGQVCLGGGFSFFMDPANVILKTIQNQIRQVLGQGATPVVVVDLDDTLFLNATRNVFYLKKLMKQDPRFNDLDSVSPTDFVGKTWEQWVRSYLRDGGFSPDEIALRERRFKEIKEEYRSTAIAEDQLITVMADYLKSLPSAVRIIYLTAREIGYREATLAELEKHRLPWGDVVFKESSESSAVYKGRRLVELLNAIPRAVLVATFDDDVKNLIQMSRAVPQGIHTQVGLNLQSAGVEVTFQRYGSCAAKARGED